MAISKSAATVFSAVTTGQTSAAIDMSGDYAAELYVDVVQTGTPTAGAAFTPQYSPDGTAFYNGPSFQCNAAAGTYDFVVSVPTTAKKVQVVFTPQAGGTTSTINAQLGQVTAV